MNDRRFLLDKTAQYFSDLFTCRVSCTKHKQFCSLVCFRNSSRCCHASLLLTRCRCCWSCASAKLPRPLPPSWPPPPPHCRRTSVATKFTKWLLLSMLISTVSLLQILMLEKYIFWFFYQYSPYCEKAALSFGKKLRWTEIQKKRSHLHVIELPYKTYE